MVITSCPSGGMASRKILTAHCADSPGTVRGAELERGVVSSDTWHQMGGL